jgi:hypothetical protein
MDGTNPDTLLLHAARCFRLARALSDNSTAEFLREIGLQYLAAAERYLDRKHRC